MLQQVILFVAAGHIICCSRSYYLLQQVILFVAAGHIICCSRSYYLLQQVILFVAAGHIICCSRSYYIIYSKSQKSWFAGCRMDQLANMFSALKAGRINSTEAIRLHIHIITALYKKQELSWLVDYYLVRSAESTKEN